LGSLLGSWACSESRETPPVAAAPRVGLRVPFELYGVPGPWWRDNATQLDFDGDQTLCRERSKQARSAADAETRREVGYRTFVDCMGELAWTKGYPPRSEPVGSAG
jgi:hypothetical protein